MKKQKALVSQRTVARMLQSAAECWRRQDYDQCIETLERASKLDPSNAAILLDLGRACGMRFDYEPARHFFERAIAAAPRKIDAMVMAALHCRDFGKHEFAIGYLERAIGQTGATPDTFVKFAELLERLRRFDDAANAVDHALELDQDSALAHLVRARLDREAGRLEQAERRLQPLVARTDSDSWSTRIRGWYELGTVLDRQGRYDEAMQAFLRAKELTRRHASPSIESQLAVHARLKEAGQNISAEVLRRWQEAGKAMHPQRRLVLLCGHPRSGTTLLEQVLDSHPQVISAEETAIFYRVYLSLRREMPASATMLSVLDSASSASLATARAKYFQSMQAFAGENIGDRILIDKNPSLTGLIPGFIRTFPETKFLVAFRDPRDVCLSCFMQPLPLNQVSAIFLTLQGAVQEYVAIMGFWKSMSQRLPSPFIEVRYEDVVENLESESRRVLEFLGLPWDAEVLRFDHHARQKLVRSPTYADVAKPISRAAVGRWRNYQKYLEPYLEQLEPFVAGLGYH